ncbi:hypothetical protein GDO86_019821 [Hymenochirus boettgeri]|uniref:Uncharacterized protein n=1 Tax=Hymenochirus boettgeri TaxID=247094 RepID=A0A8T2IGV5_9PIPI|nr:hypothetical protein GDO86_019821 [Hymenochirus boettgeri]
MASSKNDSDRPMKRAVFGLNKCAVEECWTSVKTLQYTANIKLLRLPKSFYCQEYKRTCMMVKPCDSIPMNTVDMTYTYIDIYYIY